MTLASAVYMYYWEIYKLKIFLDDFKQIYHGMVIADYGLLMNFATAYDE